MSDFYIGYEPHAPARLAVRTKQVVRVIAAGCVLIALATGLVEPLFGLVGAAAVTLAGGLLPWGLAFAAGAMLFVVSDEIVPETHRRGFATEATFGLMLGFVGMIALDGALK